MNSTQIQTIKSLLNQHRGKIFSVAFVKKNGEVRKMTARQGIKIALAGGDWANGNAGKASDHGLILCSDIPLYRAEFRKARDAGNDVETAKEIASKKSRRSFSLNSVKSLKVAKNQFTF